MGREGIGHPVHDLLGLVQAAGEKEVADDDAAFQDALAVHLIGAGLADHLPDGGSGHRRVVPGGGVLFRSFLVGVFEVGQVNLHLALQGPQGLHLVVAAAVPHHRHGQGFLQGLGHHMGVVGGVHQVDVVGPLGDEFLKNFPQTVQRNPFAEVLLADAVILAKDTAQGTAGEKDGAGPTGSGQGRLLPVMEGRSGQDGTVGHPAAALGLGAVAAAAPGTEGAAGGIIL